MFAIIAAVAVTATVVAPALVQLGMTVQHFNRTRELEARELEKHR